MINVILGFKNFLNAYDIIVGLTNGGPGTATRSVAMTIFTGFTGGDYAYQMANATIFFIITVVIALLQLAAHPRKERALMATPDPHSSPRPSTAAEAPRTPPTPAGAPAHGARQLARHDHPASLCALTRARPALRDASRWRSRRPAQAVDGNAFSLPAPVQPRRLRRRRGTSPTSRVGVRASRVLVTAGTVVGDDPPRLVRRRTRSSRNWDRKLFRWSFFYLLAAMFIPFPVVALPQIQLTGLLGLDNPVGVAILHIMFQLTFSVLLFTAFLRSIPLELEESARIDGATHLAGVLAADLPAAGADERHGRHLRLPRRRGTTS